MPTPSETKDKLGDFLSSFGRKKASSSFIDRTANELGLNKASPHKREQIIKMMEDLSQRRGQSGLNSGQNAAAKFTMLVEKKKEPMCNWSVPILIGTGVVSLHFFLDSSVGG